MRSYILLTYGFYCLIILFSWPFCCICGGGLLPGCLIMRSMSNFLRDLNWRMFLCKFTSTDHSSSSKEPLVICFIYHNQLVQSEVRLQWLVLRSFASNNARYKKGITFIHLTSKIAHLN